MRIFNIDKSPSKEEIDNGMEGAVYKVILDGEVYAYKQFFCTEGVYFDNKLYVISSLYSRRKDIEVPALLLPLGLGMEEEVLQGMLTEYVLGPTLQRILEDPTVDIYTKVGYLKQISKILKQMKKTREKKDLHDFFLNDIHEKNFILDRKRDILRVSDLDSSHIAGNHFATSKHLIARDLSLFPEKYKQIEAKKRKIIASEETELFCYAMIVMLFLTNRNVIYTMDEYMECLNFLASVGVNKELLDALAKVYSTDKNVNIGYLLDYIPESYGRIRKKQESSPHIILP